MSAADSTASPYERLLELTLAQQELVTGGRWTEAVSAGEAWQEIADTLPGQAPEEARAVLEEAARIAWSNTAAIEAHAALVARELDHIRRGRQALAGYAAAR